MFACLSKPEDECYHAMEEAFKDTFSKNLDNYNRMKSIAYAYTNNSECSVQECVYHILPGLWLGKRFQLLFLKIAIFQKMVLEFVQKSCQTILICHAELLRYY